MRILLLSAYDAESHIYWRKGLVEHLPEHEWTVLSLPGRFFSWRMRGNSLSWAFSNRGVLERPYDLIVATSMTDLSSLKGFVPSLACTPTLVYFHENQFAYPQSGKEFKSVEPCILNLYTALAADYCLFNSEYNRRTLLDGAARLLKKLPDHVPEGLIEKIRLQSHVLPVPLNKDSFLERSTTSVDCQNLNIVWNHRWEFDKNPQLLLDAITRLSELTDQYRVHVVGQQFRRIPEAFSKLKTVLGNHCGEWGFMESRTAYQKLLCSSDVVLSTALHDYQGIAVLEGAAAGAYPIVPDRLAYQELFPVECRYTGEPEATMLAKKLFDLTLVKQQHGCLPSVDVQHLSWAALTEQYRDVILQVAKPA